MIAERAERVVADDRVDLEAALALPPGAAAGVVICHPHPLYGGDMHNPVVVRIAEVCARTGLGTLRFNFRGVGGSTGAHDEGRGERSDVRAALAHLRGQLAPRPVLALAGYSFGAAMAAAVAGGGEPLDGLALVAPPLALESQAVVGALARLECPLLVVAGSEDEYCPLETVRRLAATLPEGAVAVIEGANHFFFGKLYPLGEAVARWAEAVAARARR